MKTDIITLDSNLKGRNEALEEADRFAVYNSLTGKNAMHLRLLTEETISMVHGILNGFTGDFWIECEKKAGGKLCRIHVAASTAVSEDQEEELLKISSSHRNEEAKGILGAIREIFRWAVQRTEDNSTFMTTATADLMYDMGVISADMGQSEYFWSLQHYRAELEKNSQYENSRQAWDELEKSIVANLSDEIRIGITNERATVTIERFFSTPETTE